MTDKEIDAMPAGRGFDHVIAEDVFGLFVFVEQGDGLLYVGTSQFRHEWQELPPYSTDIDAAWQVVEKMLADDTNLHLVHDGDEWTAGEKYWNGEWDESADGATPMLAICRLALKCCRNVADKKVMTLIERETI